MPEPTSRKNRPRGVTVVSILALVMGIPGLIVGGITTLGMFALLIGLGPVLYVGILMLLSAFAWFFEAYGAWTLRSWAWTLGIVLSIVTIALSLLGLLTGVVLLVGYNFPMFEYWVPVQVALAAVIVVLLQRPEAKTAMGRG